MSALTKRSTIYFDPDIHKALKLKSIESSKSVSELIHDALILELNEDAEDLEAFTTRADEKTINFEQMLMELKADGKLSY